MCGDGDIAQLGERYAGSVEVTGSIPVISTNNEASRSGCLSRYGPPRDRSEMKIGRFATTAMAILPHTDLDAALRLAFSLDVPFWPQLPHLGFAEDMYVQSLAGFPGVTIDEAQQRIGFDKDVFVAELDAYLARPAGDAVPVVAAAYEPFLAHDLSACVAVRGQVMGPISCGFRLVDSGKKPVIYDDEVRPLLLHFVAAQANAQLETLAVRNGTTFVFMDEPGLGMVFSGLSGYSESRADVDLRATLDVVDGAVAIHLCGRPDWDFLLRLPISMLSFNAFASGKTFVARVEEIQAFLEREGILCWGIVPTHEQMVTKISATFLAEQLSDLIDTLIADGIDRTMLIDQSMVAPATCNLAGTPTSVERAFALLRELAVEMRAHYA